MGDHSPIGKPFFLYLGVPFVDFGTIFGALALIMGTDIHIHVANCLDPGPWDPYGTPHTHIYIYIYISVHIER